MKNNLNEHSPIEPVFKWIIWFIIIIVILGIYANYKTYQKVQELPIPTLPVEITSSEVDLPDPILSVRKEDCEYDSLGEYKVVDIFSNPLTTKKNISYKEYTNVFKVSGTVEDWFICIISDVAEEYKAQKAYYFTTFIWFGSESNSGHINVHGNLKGGIPYDNSTDSASQFLTWKFYGSESPFKFYLPLSNIKVGDRIKWWYKYLYPLQILQRQWEIRIGWFTNDSPHYWVGKILKFRIFYKGGSIEPIGTQLK